MIVIDYDPCVHGINCEVTKWTEIVLLLKRLWLCTEMLFEEFPLRKSSKKLIEYHRKFYLRREAVENK